jgi:hypothetical protein
MSARCRIVLKRYSYPEFNLRVAQFVVGSIRISLHILYWGSGYPFVPLLAGGSLCYNIQIQKC